MFEQPGARDRAVFGHVADDERRAVGALGEVHEGDRALAHLGDAAGTRFDFRERHRLNRVDDERARCDPGECVQHGAQVRFGKQEQVVACAQPLRAQLGLGRGFFTANVHDRSALGREARCELQQERRLPRAGRSPDQHQAPGHDSPTEQHVEFADPARDPRNGAARDIAEPNRPAPIARCGPRRADGRAFALGRDGRSLNERVPRLARGAAAKPAHRLVAAPRTEERRPDLGYGTNNPAPTYSARCV